MNKLYFYKVQLVRVIDGDTLKLKVDLGFHLGFVENFRLSRINTPEIRGDERPQGLKAKDYVIWLFRNAVNEDTEIFIKSEKHGKFRWLAEVWIGDLNLNDHLLESGYAEKY